MDHEIGKERKKPRPPRMYTPEFKGAAVRLVLEERQPKRAVARDLDLTPSVLDNWVRQAQIDAGKGPVGALTSSEREELVRLRRENRQLQMERAILKKAAAFFAKESR